MKKLTAIFLLCCFVINLVGYQFFYYFEVKASDQKMEASLDKNEYQSEDLITIRIPLSLPYQNDTKDFERISGEVSYKGKIYKYVKRKIENGDFVLLCIPDHKRMQLEREKNELVKGSLDQAGNTTEKQRSGSNILKYAFSEFEQYMFILKISNLPLNPNKYASFDDATFISLRITSLGQPPDHLS